MNNHFRSFDGETFKCGFINVVSAGQSLENHSKPSYNSDVKSSNVSSRRGIVKKSPCGVPVVCRATSSRFGHVHSQTHYTLGTVLYAPFLPVEQHLMALISHSPFLEIDAISYMKYVLEEPYPGM